MEVCHPEQRGWGNISKQIQSQKAFTQLQGYSFFFTFNSLSPPRTRSPNQQFQTGTSVLDKETRRSHCDTACCCTDLNRPHTFLQILATAGSKYPHRVQPVKLSKSCPPMCAITFLLSSLILPHCFLQHIQTFQRKCLPKEGYQNLMVHAEIRGQVMSAFSLR